MKIAEIIKQKKNRQLKCCNYLLSAGQRCSAADCCGNAARVHTNTIHTRLDMDMATGAAGTPNERAAMVRAERIDNANKVIYVEKSMNARRTERAAKRSSAMFCQRELSAAATLTARAAQTAERCGRRRQRNSWQTN